MSEGGATACWEAELDDLLLRVGGRFGRVEPRRRMRDYVRGLLGPIGRKNSWQPAEHAGHATLRDTAISLLRLNGWKKTAEANRHFAAGPHDALQLLRLT